MTLPSISGAAKRRKCVSAMTLFRASAVAAVFALGQTLSFAQAVSDTTPPRLMALSFSSSSVNVSSAAQTLTIHATITDDLAGFSSAYPSFTSPSGQYPYANIYYRTSGTDLNVNSDQMSATFNNVVTLSTVVAYLSNGSILGDVSGDGVVNCVDVSIAKAAFGKRLGQVGYNSAADLNADLNNDGTIDIRDLSIITRQLPAGLACH